MAGQNAFLWQVQASGSAPRLNATSANIIEFNDSGKIPSSGAYIDSIDVDFRRAVPENEAVDDDNNEIQDMGIGGLDVVIHGFVGNVDNDVDSTNPINKFSKWLKDGNTTTGFTKGRYGLELNNAPQWDVQPSTTYGYHIRNFQIKYLGEKRDLAEFTISLALGGDLKNAI